MRVQLSRWPILFVMVLSTAACEDKSAAEAAAAASASAVAAAAKAAALAKAEAEKEPPAGPCQAAGAEPTQLGTVHGDVHALALGATELYYASWSVYGGRGDVGWFRKDGKGTRTLASLDLEPRGLAVDDQDVYYTSGIRMMKVPKAGGETKTLAEIFSSQDIALDDKTIYGVPGDYGPYDRIAKLAKKGGSVDEINGGPRPDIAVGPNGFSRVVLSGGDLFVTDSGRGRILRFAPKEKKPKILTQGVPQAFELAIVGDNVVFDLARKRELMSSPKDGGRAHKIASGLVEDAPVAGNGKVVVSLLRGKTDEDPHVIVAVDPEGGEPKELAQVSALDNVPDIAVDDRCVYWAQRKNASETLVFAKAL